MGIFAGIEHVAAEGTSLWRYFEPGQYTVTIDSVFLYERSLGRGKLFIVETTVSESDNPNIKPGDRCNWVQSFALSSPLPRIKPFIGAAMGLCPSRHLREINAEVTEAVCDSFVAAKNPLRGTKLRLTCVGKTTSKGKEFVQHSWGVY